MTDFKKLSDKELVEIFHEFNSKDIDGHSHLGADDTKEALVEKLEQKDDSEFEVVENSDEAVRLVREIKRRKEEKGAEELQKNVGSN
jgi:hypothetical protein